MPCWLELEDGARLRLLPRGLLIGRDAAVADIVVRDPRISRRQAIVYQGSAGPELVPLGKRAVEVNGEEAADARLLQAGDHIRLPGWSARLRVEPDPEPVSRWLVERPGGGLIGIPGRGLSIGGGPHDDLQVAGAVEGALRFQPMGPGLFATVVAPLPHVREPLLPGDLLPLHHGDVFQVGEALLTVLFEPGGQGVETTRSAAPPLQLRRVQLDFLPRGGLLCLDQGSVTHSLYLSDRRCDLLAALLQPAPPLLPGDFVSDTLLLPRVWAEPGARRRTNLNNLVFWARQDLSAAGFGEPDRLERLAGGGATRFRLDPGCTVGVSI